MKHILFTDLHVGLSTEFWDDLALEAIKYLDEIAQNNKIESVLFLGDFFHNRRELNVKSINTAYKIGNILNKYQTHMICGNHDSYYKNTNEVNSLSIMEKFDNIKIYIEPIIINNKIVMVPWGCDYREYDVPVCMGHFDIKDFQLNDNSVSKHGEDPKNFKKFDLVLSGHFHKYSEKNNIKYIGNMYGHNFNDINAQRGLWIFDDETLDMEFFEFTKAPKFIKIQNNEFNVEEIENNIIRVYFDNKLSDKEMSDVLVKIESLNPHELSVDYSGVILDSISTREEEISIKNDMEILKEYIEKIELPKDIHQEKLLNFIYELETNE